MPIQFNKLICEFECVSVPSLCLLIIFKIRLSEYRRASTLLLFPLQYHHTNDANRRVISVVIADDGM